MESESLREELVSAVAALEENKVYEIVNRMLESGEAPISIIEYLREGMEIIGDEYSHYTRALCDLVMASEILKSAMHLVEPSLKRLVVKKSGGRVVIGTVQGDIHDIGKNLVISMLECAGSTIYDLGVDVPRRSLWKRLWKQMLTL